MGKVIYDFTGQRALVTGAGGGIGHEIASQLIVAGCTVVGFDLKDDPADFPESAGHMHYVQGDIRDADQLQHAFDLCGGALDHIVNAAGVALMDRDGSVVDIELDMWQKTMDINLMGAVHTARAGVPLLVGRGGGSIVHIASIVGIRSMENALEAGPMDAYQISKAALVSLSRGLALTYGRQNVRSNTICPGSIHTPMTHHIYEKQERIESMAARTPLARLGYPQDIAAACLYLLSDEAAFITGTDMVVDGGLTAKIA